MRVIAVASLIALVALAGCLENKPADPAYSPEDGEYNPFEPRNQDSGGDQDAQPRDEDRDTDDSDEPEDDSNGAPENRAPTAQLTAPSHQGDAPFNVTFRLDGSDDDGDELAWTLDADGDGVTDAEGMELPTQVVHLFDEPGLYTAALNVTDGTLHTATTLQINVTEAGPAGPEFPLSFSGDVVASCIACQEVGGTASLGFNAGEAGLDSTWFELPVGVAGHAFQTSESADLDSDVEFFETCSADAASVGSFRSIDAHESGEVPNGAGCAVLWTWYPGPATVTLVIT